MKNRFTKLLNNNRKMTLLSAIIPVISLLIFNGSTGIQIACAYMYVIAPFITLRFLGHKFKKVSQYNLATKKGEASKTPELWRLNDRKYSLSELTDITKRNATVVILSLFTLAFFNGLHIPFAGQLVLAGPYLLIHTFFFVTGETLSLLNLFVPLSNGPKIDTSSFSGAPSSSSFSSIHSPIDPLPKRTDMNRAFYYDGSYTMQTRRE